MARIIYPTVILGLLFLCSCQSIPARSGAAPSSRPCRRLLTADLSKADPAGDVANAIKAGDMRFIGMNGFTKFVPGLEYFPELTQKFGVCYIDDLSDSTNQNEAIVEQCLEYAQIYNLLLFRHLRRANLARWEDYAWNPGGPASRPSRSK